MSVIDLEDKVSVIVGAGGEIGSKIAKTLAEAGSKTMIIDIDTKNGEKLSE